MHGWLVKMHPGVMIKQIVWKCEITDILYICLFPGPMLTFKSKKSTNETPKSILNSQEGRKNPFKVLNMSYFVIIVFFIRNVMLDVTFCCFWHFVCSIGA